MNTQIYSRLSAMMFLQFFVWGAWFVTLGNYLYAIGFQAVDIGAAYLMNNLGAIIAPFFVGMIADRFFASEKVAGVMHLIGAVVLYYVAGLTDVGPVLVGLFLYNACYMSTLGLANSISFNQMETPDTQFPPVRVWGTLGWITAGLGISLILAPFVPDVEATNVPLKLAAICSAVLGLYCFSLPSTPPSKIGEAVTVSDILGLKALALLKDKSFAVFALCSLLISIPLAFYYGFTNLFLNEIGMEGVAGKMTMGQMSEVGFMILMPFFFKRLGVKWMLLVGMLAWVLRYGLFAGGDAGALVGMLYGGILLHGICYDFFFVTGQIYVDRKASTDIRASAQGFIALITYGAGMAIGSYIAGQVVQAYTVEDTHNWEIIWMVPCIFAGLVALVFAVIFKDNTADEMLTEAKGVNP